jgi:hypothetical protein
MNVASDVFLSPACRLLSAWCTLQPTRFLHTISVLFSFSAVFGPPLGLKWRTERYEAIEREREKKQAII